MFALFFARLKPVSTIANPGCIANTRIAPSSIHRLFTVNISGLTAAAAEASAFSASSCASAGVQSHLVSAVVFAVTLLPSATERVRDRNPVNLALEEFLLHFAELFRLDVCYYEFHVRVSFEYAQYIAGPVPVFLKAPQAL